MTQKIDDYYSTLSSGDADNSTKKKRPTIKKKIKVKAKKIEPQVQDVQSTQTDESVSTSGVAPRSVNEAIEKQARPSFQVVSRQEKPSSKHVADKDVKAQKQKTSSQNQQVTQETPKATPQETSGEKKAPKFKPGFSRSHKIGEENTSEDRNKKTSKKSKLFPQGKSKKYKNNFSEDLGFTRSNKIKTKKKEDKKIEDIEQNIKAKTGETITIPEFLSLKEFSEKIGVALPQLIAEFMKNGMMMTINSQIDFDTASLIAEAFEVILKKEDGQGVAIDDIASGNIKDLIDEEDSSLLEDRAPVISIMGHVDHGKTSLLDYIRKSQVAAGEAGGITQSIGAYQVEHNEKKITFLDTPGHEAFTIMRSRGAKSTDIAILVVAADEGVKPQTIESISHAREANIPVIVAINKMDKEGANPDHVKGQLAEHGLTPEDWGGETPMIPVSAHTGFGIDELLEIILLVAEMQELKANPNRLAIATIIESHLDTQLGPVATILMNTGTLEKGTSVVCSGSYGKVKVLKDYTSKNIKFVGPGSPALVVGLDKVVEGGDILQAVSGVDVARQKAAEYDEYTANQKKLKASQLDVLMSKIKSGNLKHLKIVLKADTNGSLEAIKNALLKLSTEETNVSVIHSGVGNVTEGDVLMCGGSSAILIAFGVGVGVNAKDALEQSGVEYIESKIIYHITERIEKIVTGMLDPKEIEISLCEAKVGGIFYTSKKFLILGLHITAEESRIENGALVRVIRGDKMVGKGKIESLKQGVEEVKSLSGPIECGIKLTGVKDVQEKDILEVYKITVES